jgi:hypothetical protein
MDPLSDVLRSVRLTGGVFLKAHFTAPWCVTANMTAEDCRPFLATPAQLIAYHFIIVGRMLVSLEGQPARKQDDLAGADLDPGHMLASAPGLEPVSAGTLINRLQRADWPGFATAEVARRHISYAASSAARKATIL